MGGILILRLDEYKCQNKPKMIKMSEMELE